ncbi:GTP-binding protein [Myxosarcina sp. GI1]|uniref:GTP-binding protein n=1 Tax=Myxosarcina sp. GI1 TaxID=1541065 RepID=UPI00068C3A27|nr:GTP-binding protein [Myxosarcina sp. GI1]
MSDTKTRHNTELDNTIFSLEEITAEINYRKAQKSLRNLIDNIDLTTEERSGLDREIERLSQMLDKLEHSVVQIAAFGMVGRGKSSVLNALVGEDVFPTGALHGVTRDVGTANWQLQPEPIANSTENLQRLTIPTAGGQIQLLDTPGIDEVNGKTREALACNLARQVDLILFTISGDITQVEYRALSKLREAGKPMLLVFNKIDQYPEADRLAIYNKIKEERVKELISPEEIVMVAASPVEVKGVKDKHGKLKVTRDRGLPQVEQLKLKILELLQQEGKSLVALNSMLFADEVNERLLQRKLELRDRAANDLINKGMMLKAMAVALNPVTAIDLFAGAIMDVALILALSRLYGIEMTQAGAVKLLKNIALSMGGISLSELLTTFGLSSLKGILGVSVPLTGGIALAPYLSVAIAQGGVAGVSSYAIGQITKTYLANGASWGEQSPKTVVKTILDSLDERSILNRIKSELQDKLTLSQNKKSVGWVNNNTSQ